MADELESLTLRYLRSIDAKLDQLGDDMQVVKSRLATLEQQYATLSLRLDQVDLRVQRIERRLDLAEAD
jgi:septation ring formation regulator EzrA